MNHRLIKMLEDLKVATDGSVRDSRNRLYQMSYGADGLDSIRLIRCPVPHMSSTEKQFRQFCADQGFDRVTTDTRLVPLFKEMIRWNSTASRTLPTHTEGVCRLPFQPSVLLKYASHQEPSSFDFDLIQNAFHKHKLSKVLLWVCICAWTPRALQQHSVSFRELTQQAVGFSLKSMVQPGFTVHNVVD